MSDDSHNPAKAPHVLAIGDIVTDAFIKLSEDYAESSTDDKGYKRLSFELGAKLPYDSVEIIQAVECSPNAAVSMSRLGLGASLVSWLGDDGPGKDMIEYLKGEGVGTDELVVEHGQKTNYHYVLRYGGDRTKLQRFEDYSYEWKAPHQRPDWLYLGVLGEKTWPLHEGILGYLESNPDIKLAFQPGMYHLMWGAEKMKDFYKRAEVVVLNREEAVTVTGGDHDDVHDLIDKLHGLGPKIVAVTDGPNGAYASDGRNRLTMPLYPDPAPPADRTGAGDAFASTFVASLAQGHDLESALQRAPINSMAVCQKVGAQAGLLTGKELERYLQDAPSGYHPEQLS
ncbi:MAG TPA: carbohydrate kinase family protein [Candidatus Saccharimonadales bacterium]|nr:carbohydrate kinase family protein [Candidatus Saccharimonadales bacterium]